MLPQLLERNRRQRVGRRASRCDALEREQERGCRDGECHERGDRLWPRKPAGEPDDERDEHRRSDRQELPLRDVLDEARRKGADLDDRDRRVGDGSGDERPDARVLLAPSQHLPREDAEGDEGDSDRQQGECPRLPGDRAGDVRERVGGRVREGRIGADELTEAAQRDPARDPNGPEDPEHADRGQHPPEGSGRALGDREQEYGDHDRRDKPDRLESRRQRDPDGDEQERLVGERRRAQADGERPGRRHRRRVVERLAHEQAAVREAGNDDRERRREERPARPRDRSCPEEHRNRGRRHQQRLQRLDTCDTVGDVSDEERHADEQRVEEAVVRHPFAKDGQPVAVAEGPAEEAVEVLVGGDPGRVHSA